MLFPYFGGKTKIAAQVWDHLGDPECYIEPFAGSLAVLLARPTTACTEIAVDLDGLLVNFWRCIQQCWPEVQTFLTGMVAESDLRAKHNALLGVRDFINEKLVDPVWCDPLLAAWWWEGISSYLGSGFGHRPARQRPHIDRSLKGAWANGMTDAKVEWVVQRLANVVLLAGDWQDAWKRSATPAIINRFNRGVGVFLDPPYAGDRSAGLYAEDQSLNQQITEWCLLQPRHVKVVVAGYDNEYPALKVAGWNVISWKAPNGYAGKTNKRRGAEVLYVKRDRRVIPRGRVSSVGRAVAL